MAADLVPLLNRDNIPFISFSDGSFFDQPEIRSLLYFLSFIFQHEFSGKKLSDWSTWWNAEEWAGDVFGLSDGGKKIIAKLEGSISELTDEKTIRKSGFSDKADISKVLRLNVLRRDITNKKSKQILHEALFDFFSISGFLKRLTDASDERSIEKLLNIGLLTRLIAGYCDTIKRPGINGLLTFLYDRSKHNSINKASLENSDSVRIMTVHKSKGLEFPLVIIPGLTENSFPSRFRDRTVCGIHIPEELLPAADADEQGKLHYHEELRLFYVALTRAQDGLILLSSERINSQKAKPSSFLELIKDYITDDSDALHRIKKDYAVPDEVRQISYSSLSTYNDCPFRYWLTYEMGLRTPALYRQRLGAMVHTVLQLLNNDLKSGNEPGKKEIEMYLDQYWEDICKPAEKDKLRSDLVKDFLAWLGLAKDRYQSIEAVEQSFSYVGLAKDNVLIRGKTDLIARRKDGNMELIDFKATNTEGMEVFDLETQLNLYRKCLGHDDIAGLAAYTFFDHAFHEIKIDPEGTEEYLKKNVRGISDLEYPKNLDSPFCTNQGACPYKFICKEQ